MLRTLRHVTGLSTLPLVIGAAAISGCTLNTGLASVTYTPGSAAGQANIKAGTHGVPALSFNILIT